MAKNNHNKSMKWLYLLSVIPVVAFLFIYSNAEAQLRYNLDEPVIHVKFFQSNSTSDLSTQFNKFIVEKEFESKVFQFQSIEVIEFDSLDNRYSIMVTYLDLNEESPQRAIEDLEQRILNRELEQNPI